MNNTINKTNLDFQLPKILECSSPTEVRNLKRDEVKLMVSERHNDKITHTQFSNIDHFLTKNNVLVVNTSGTINAALKTTLPNNEDGRIHLSTQISKNEWIAEIRKVVDNKTVRYTDIEENQILSIPNNHHIKIVSPFYDENRNKQHLQLWKISFFGIDNMDEYLNKYGQAIAYSTVDVEYPQSYYQTVFAKEMGSSEMPSAGRAFTPYLIEKLKAKGVKIVPILLHTGVSSLEANEKPYPEYFEVSKETANALNEYTLQGKRIIAVGTTAIRAVESATNKKGKVQAQKGWTNLFITPANGIKIIDGMLTGFHEPKASHLLMMQALATTEHLSICYNQAIENSYKWHEFGDMHLLM